jgi:hypothetical protein
MKLFSSILLITSLSLLTLASQAATGCLSSNTTYTYINPEGINRNGVPSYYHRYESDRMVSTATYCAVPTGGSCYIYATRSGYSSSPGTLVYYNTVNNCDIDDYTGVLAAGFAMIGFFYIRKKKRFLSIKDSFNVKM